MVKIFYGRFADVYKEMDSWIKANKNHIKILSINNAATSLNATFPYVFSTILYEEI